jgi:hypothetical protein
MFHLLIDISKVNHIAFFFSSSKSHMIIFNLFNFAGEINNFEMIIVIFGLELVILMLIKSSLDLFISYILCIKLNLLCKMHDDNIII